MSRNNERRKEREIEANAEYETRQREWLRKENLSMYDRIDESDASSDVKDILHRLAQAAGLEL